MGGADSDGWENYHVAGELCVCCKLLNIYKIVDFL
jgi:hypothetical protein